MNLKQLGIFQIVMGIIFILAEFERHGVFRNFLGIFSIEVILFTVFGILIILVGIRFVKSKKDINFHVDEYLSKVGLNIPKKSVGIFLLIIGVLLFSYQIYGVGLLNNLSFSRLGIIFFDDQRIPFTVISILSIVIGIYIVRKNR